MSVIRLATISNLRDLGGLPTRDGRKIRSGCLLRSAHLAEASPEDLQYLHEHHRLTRVIDLRTALEREQMPDLTGPLSYTPMPLLTESEAGFTREKRPLDQMEIPDMPVLYRRIVTDEAIRKRLSVILRSILSFDFSNGAVLWHCSEGKDRCGMISALILEALNVDRKVIMTDFLETNTVNLPKAEAMYRQVLPEYGEKIAQGVFDTYAAKEIYLLSAWDGMGDNFLTGSLGIGADMIARFQNAVLV